MTNIPCRKIIKASIFILIGFPFCDLLAQTNTRGIYNSWQDYNSNKLSLILNCNSPKNKIKLHHFFCGNYIDIIENGKQFRFKKDSIFGYRDCRQNDFRFYHNNEKEYRIAENSSIIIYVADVPVIASSGKTRTLVPAYFFSTTLNGEIFPLTILNLKKAFPGNLKFHDKLDVVFGDETPVSTYDSKHKMYKVNFLLTQSLSNYDQSNENQ